MRDRARYLWLFLHFTGRIDRSVYFLANLLIGVIQLFPIWKAMMALMELGPETLADASLEQIMQMSPAFAQWWSIAGFLTFIMLWPYFALAAKRFHDMGWKGVSSITLVIPIIQLFAFIALCLVPGNPGPNQYGARRNVPAGV